MASSTAAVPNTIVPEFLNYKNYEHWSQRIKTYLLSQDLWDVVESTTKIPKIKVWARKNAKALHIIQISCGSDMFSVISEISSAQTAWAALETRCKEELSAENHAKELERYIPFTDYVKAGDWENAKECLIELPDAITAIDPRDEHGNIALHVAARDGHLHIVKELVLLMSQEDLHTKNAKGSTAIHEALLKGQGDILEELLPVMGRAQNCDGDTVLHIEVGMQQMPQAVKEMVKLMGRTDLEVKNNNGCTALNIAVEMGNVHIIKELLPSDDDVSDAVIEGDDWNNAKCCRRDLDQYRAVKARDPRDGHDGNTALHVAVKHGHMHIVREMVSLMISHRIDRNMQEKNADPFTGKLHADLSEGEIVERAKYMVEENEIQLAVVLEQQNAFGDTPLHQAVTKGHMPIVKDLVLSMRQEGFEIKNKQGLTALHQAVKMGNVGIVKELVSVMRQEGLEVIDDLGNNALHKAALEKKMEIVRELIPLMRPQALEATNIAGHRALGCAIDVDTNYGEIFEMAKYMAEKNKKVFGICSPDAIPVVWAADWGNWKLTHYLYSVTPPDVLNGSDGADLLVYAISKLKALDLAWDLLQHYPRLAIHPENSLLYEVAASPYAFLSGEPLTFWQMWIYNGLHIQPSNNLNVPETFMDDPNIEDDQDMSSFTKFMTLSKLLGIDDIYLRKSVHEKVMKILCFVTRDLSTSYDSLTDEQQLTDAIFRAIEMGHVEFVTHICEVFPFFTFYRHREEGTIFHFAVRCRREKIYSLIYGLKKENKNRAARSCIKEVTCNSLLHSVANLSPLSKFRLSSDIQGANLQMQRELQWFKEVESLVPPDLHTYENSDGLTARQVFTQSHEELMKDAKESIKQTASSCTVVGALIATMMFAAAFTVPGGNNGNSGIPMFIQEKLFLTFIVSDALSLVFSTTSVIVFLGLLTSRYSEDDFLVSLPRKLMIGLVTLFISIATMMIAFAFALIIMLHGRYSWIVAPSISLACVPIASFVWVQFPLLLNIFISTYGPGIFDKKTQPWYNTLMQDVKFRFGFATKRD